jgi:hypothetical protein
MGTGFLRLIRWAAAFGMFLAFVHFLVAFSVWASPVKSRQWVGLRMSEVLRISSPGKPGEPPSAGRLADYARVELINLFAAVREPSTWFCLTGILYLFAGHQLRSRWAVEELELE